VLFGTLCFHAQQAAEKAAKAALVLRNIPPPRSHDLRHLLSLLPADTPIPAEVRAAVVLSQHATTSRYPDDSEEVDEAEWRECVRLAAAVLAWAEALAAA
jgi:HEPN domain-containing protein